VSGMTGLSRSFYEVACEFTVWMSRGETAQLIKYPSAVVILNVACLEAYLNEHLSVIRQMDAAKWEDKIAALYKKNSLEKRWMKAPLLFGASTFEAEEKPFRSFHLLICLRNTLVHYRPRFRTTTEFPSQGIKALEQEFSFTHKDKADWTSQVLNLDCARWACRTTKAMVKKFHELAGGNDESNLPYPWSDPA
jgi:hypothetical protein